MAAKSAELSCRRGDRFNGSRSNSMALAGSELAEGISESAAGGDGVLADWRCASGDAKVFPASDCVLLPIVHASAEELAGYVLTRLREGLGTHAMRGLTEIEVGVSEAPGQAAFCRAQL